MVEIRGTVYAPNGQPTTDPFNIWLVDYGTDSDILYTSPHPVTVTPDLTGSFTTDLWANVDSDNPCYYRVQFDFGLTLKIQVPNSVTPLEFTDLIVDESIESIPGIVYRVAQLEDAVGTGGGALLPQPFALGGYLTSPTVIYNGTSGVILEATSIDAAGLTGTLPTGVASNLTFGTGLEAGSYDGSSPTTINIDTGVVVQGGDSRLTDAREWIAPTATQLEAENGTSTDRLAFTPQRIWQAIASWWVGAKATLTASDVGLENVPNIDTTNAANLSSGQLDVARLPSPLNSDTATVLQTPRSINGILFDGSQDITIPGSGGGSGELLTPGLGLSGNTYNGSTAETWAIDTGVVIQEGDSRLTDSREWVATTATQLEAEDSANTTRLAFTPQRVWQAIAAWWAGSADKTKLDGIAAGADVSPVTSVSGKTGVVTLTSADVGLGNVANSDTTNATNITSGTLDAARLPTPLAATTAQTLATPRNINGVAFDGSQDITIATGGGGLPVLGDDTTLLESADRSMAMSIDVNNGGIDLVQSTRFNIELIQSGTSMAYVRMFGNNVGGSGSNGSLTMGTNNGDGFQIAGSNTHFYKRVRCENTGSPNSLASSASLMVYGGATFQNRIWGTEAIFNNIQLETPININGVPFDLTSDITVPASVETLTPGLGLTGSVYDGSTAITWDVDPATVPTLNQSTTGNAATATVLATPRNINGVAFNGSANISVPTIGSLTPGVGLTGTAFDGLTNRTFNIDDTVVWELSGTQSTTGNKFINTTGRDFALIDDNGDVANYFWYDPDTVTPTNGKLRMGSSTAKPFFRAAVEIDDATTSTSGSSGALVVGGKTGIGNGDIFTDGDITAQTFKLHSPLPSAGQMSVLSRYPLTLTDTANPGQGAYYSWGASSTSDGSGLNECTEFFCDRGTGTGGYKWYVKPDSVAPNLVMYLNGSGGLTINGQMNLGTQIIIENPSDGQKTFLRRDTNNTYLLVDRNSDGSWETPHPITLNHVSNTCEIFGNTAWTQGNLPQSDGQWTPTLNGTGWVYGSGTYGEYSRNGKQVVIAGAIDIDTVGSDTIVRLNNLPFNSRTVTFISVRLKFLTIDTTEAFDSLGYCNDGSQIVFQIKRPTSGAGNLLPSLCAAGTIIHFAGSYITDDA